MIIDRFTQQPRECRFRKIDYTLFFNELDTLHADTLPTIEVALLRGSADDSASPLAVGNLVRVDDNTIGYSVSGGAHGNTYLVTFLTLTAGGQVHEAEIEFKIKETGTAQGPRPAGSACA